MVLGLMRCEITIDKYRFTGVKSVKIKKSTKLISDTASIELPLKAFTKEKARINLETEIKRGNKVLIKLGYNDDIKEEFKGYVTNVCASETLKIECEDSIFLLRTELDNKLFIKSTLKDILNYVVEKTDLEISGNIPDVEFNKFPIRNTDGVQVLKKLSDEYPFSCFIDYEGKLYAGLENVYNSGNVEYQLQKDKVIKNNLKLVKAEDRKFKVKAISLLKNNQRIIKEFGDTNGELKTIFLRNITDEKKIEELAEKKLEKYKFTGYEGNFTTYLIPYVLPGMSAGLTDSFKNLGTYFVESVTSSFDESGGRRNIEPGIKL